jgi:hypothetical protein
MKKTYFHRLFIACFAIASTFAGTARATKAEGPFSISTKIEGHHAVVSISTPVAAAKMELHIYGSDGLEVLGAATNGPLHVRAFTRDAIAKGETWTEEVDFKPGDGMCYLNVWVGGSGQPSVVRSFSVGTLSEKQKAERNKGVRLDPDGKPVRIMDN